MTKVLGIGAGRYIINQVLYRGGFSVVYRGRRVGSPELVAVRQLKDGSERKEKDVFQNGISVHQLLDPESRRFPRLHDHSDNVSALEYIDGKQLTEYAGQKEEVALAVAYELADCLGEFHGRGVVHRDVKTENLLVRREEGETWFVLIDFDLGFVRGRPDPAKGIFTRGYASPEQIEGRAAKPQTDVYSAGSTLYHVLTGSKPRPIVWEDDYKRKVFIQPNMEGVDPKSHAGQVIANCWRMNGHQYQNAEDLRDDVGSRLKRFGIKKSDVPKILGKMKTRQTA